MARGWESKSVEDQMEMAAERVAAHKAAVVSEAATARQREIESLELSRTRVLQDMAAATNPKYKQMLEQSLAFLDEKLAKATAGG